MALLYDRLRPDGLRGARIAMAAYATTERMMQCNHGCQLRFAYREGIIPLSAPVLIQCPRCKKVYHSSDPHSTAWRIACAVPPGRVTY